MIPQITLTYNEGVSIFVQIGVFAILYFLYNLFIDKKNILIVIYTVFFITLWLFLIQLSNNIIAFTSYTFRYTREYIAFKNKILFII